MSKKPRTAAKIHKGAQPTTLAHAHISIGEGQAAYNNFLIANDKWINELADIYDQACAAADKGEDLEDVILRVWNAACDCMSASQAIVIEATRTTKGGLRRRIFTVIAWPVDRLAERMMSRLGNDACDHIGGSQALVDQARRITYGRLRRRFVAAVTSQMDRLADLMRTIAVVWPELELETPENITKAVWTVTITPGAYLRAMGNVFWSAIRHPFSETTIELKTGRVLYHT